MLRLTSFCNNTINKLNDLLVDRICLVDCLDHLLLGNFVGSCFNHHDFLRRGSDRQF